MLSVTHQHYFSNLKNGENYNLKPETYYVLFNRLTKGDAKTMVLLLAMLIKTLTNRFFIKHFHEKQFILTSPQPNCLDRKFFPSSTSLTKCTSFSLHIIKWKDSFLKIIYRSLYVLKDLISSCNQHFFQRSELLLSNFNCLLIGFRNKQKVLAQYNILISGNQESSSPHINSQEETDGLNASIRNDWMSFNVVERITQCRCLIHSAACWVQQGQVLKTPTTALSQNTVVEWVAEDVWFTFAGWRSQLWHRQQLAVHIVALE